MNNWVNDMQFHCRTTILMIQNCISVESKQVLGTKCYYLPSMYKKSYFLRKPKQYKSQNLLV